MRSPGLIQQEIADRMLVARSNVSMLLSRMQKSGLLERTKDERDPPHPADLPDPARPEDRRGLTSGSNRSRQQDDLSHRGE
jgi:hypothetical protein